MSEYSRSQRVRRRIFFWFADDLYDLLERIFGEARACKINDGFVDPYVEEPLVKTLCLLFGHEPIAECGYPSHDACLYCRKSMPGRADRSPA